MYIQNMEKGKGGGINMKVILFDHGSSGFCGVVIWANPPTAVFPLQRCTIPSEISFGVMIAGQGFD